MSAARDRQTYSIDVGHVTATAEPAAHRRSLRSVLTMDLLIDTRCLVSGDY